MSEDPQTAKANDLKALLAVSPDAYPQNLDLIRGLVLVIRMDARAYRAASFLDDRVLGAATQGAWLPGAAVTEVAGGIADPRPLHFIFHTGHVGSTLLSRLLDETGIVLGLREPLALRAMADAHDLLSGRDSLLSGAQFANLLEMMLRLWSRGYDWTRAVVVKATSSAGRLSATLLDAAPQSRAVYMSLRAEPYLATLLGGANSATDLRGHGPGRMRRLLARRELAVPPLHALSPGELAALGWLVESLSCQDAMRAHADRVLPIDFDAFMDDVTAGINRALAHFGLPRDDDLTAAVSRSPVLQQYSKSPDLPFPPDERGARLAESRRLNRAEIAAGMAWLETLARQDSEMAAVVAGHAS